MHSKTHTSPKLRPDYQKIQQQCGDRRSPERLLAHYLLERRLAKRLFNSSKTERGSLYTEVYTELFESLPDHPQHTAVRSNESRDIQLNLKYMHEAMTVDAVFLEIGCGDAEMSYTAAGTVRQVYGLDVTDSLIDYSHVPPNFSFLKTSGTNIDLQDNSVDVAHSNQLLEHLHPEDAENQVREVVRVLKPNGTYWCRTPNRVTGPHDVSRYFDYTATGFHLFEYDYVSIRRLFLNAGFNKVRFFFTVRGKKAPFPYWMARSGEIFLTYFPQWSDNQSLKHLMNLNVIGIK
jgi:ubiquinone/menaquinone biosynthesis C-methylase UbiE